MVIDTLRSLQKQECCGKKWSMKLIPLKLKSHCFHVDANCLPAMMTVWRVVTHRTPQKPLPAIVFEALDNTISCLKDLFNQPGYNIYCNLEELLIKASLKGFKQPLQAVYDFYQDDFNRDLLEAQLLTFAVNFQCDTTSSGESTKPTIFNIRD